MVTGRAVGVCALATLFAGCSGSHSSSSSAGTTAAGTTGNVSIAIKDAPSDHIARFEVDVTSLDLVRDDGLLVAVLPGKTRLDLAQLVNASQLLAVTAVPRGTYTSLKISFDLSAASVLIAGNTTAAQLVDTSGAALSGVVTRSIEMKAKPIVAEPGLARFVEIDFDLDASCTIDAAGNRITLGPVLKAETEPANPVQTRIGGLLASVTGGQGQGGSFEIELRPPAAPAGSGPRVRVTVNANTPINVNGKAADFQALVALPLGAPVQVDGQLSAGRDTIVADRVNAGDPKDVVDGLVTARTPDGTLTVVGRAVDYPAGTATDGKWTVRLQGARIDLPGPGAPLATNLPQESIAVGQRIDARGDLSGSTLDASKGMVIILDTPVAGIARGAANGGVLAMEVLNVAGRPVADLDFKVGNTVSADPKNFLVNTSTLNIGTVTSGTPVVIHGVLTAYNAPSSSPDMNAKSVADRTNVTAVLQCDWASPTGKPFATLGPGGFVIDLTNAGKKQVDLGPTPPQQLTSGDKPETVASGSGPAPRCLIVQGENVTEHASMAAFSADLSSRLAGGKKARSVNAIGQWDANGKKLAAQQVTVNLE